MDSNTTATSDLKLNDPRSLQRYPLPHARCVARVTWNGAVCWPVVFLAFPFCTIPLLSFLTSPGPRHSSVASPERRIESIPQEGSLIQ